MDRGSSYYKKDGLKNHLGGGRQNRNDTQVSNFVNNNAFDDTSDAGSNFGPRKDSAYVNNQAFNDYAEDDDVERSKANAVNNRNDSD